MGKYRKGDVVLDNEGNLGQVVYELDNGVYCVITIKNRKVMHQYHPENQLKFMDNIDFDHKLEEIGYKVDRKNANNWVVVKI